MMVWLKDPCNNYEPLSIGSSIAHLWTGNRNRDHSRGPQPKSEESLLIGKSHSCALCPRKLCHSTEKSFILKRLQLSLFRETNQLMSSFIYADSFPIGCWAFWYSQQCPDCTEWISSWPACLSWYHPYDSWRPKSWWLYPGRWKYVNYMTIWLLISTYVQIFQTIASISQLLHVTTKLLHPKYGPCPQMGRCPSEMPRDVCSLLLLIWGLTFDLQAVKPAIMVIMEPWSTPKMHRNATFRIKPSIKPSILEWLIHLNPFDDNRWFDNPIKEAYQPNLYISFTIQGVGITPT